MRLLTCGLHLHGTRRGPAALATQRGCQAKLKLGRLHLVGCGFRSKTYLILRRIEATYEHRHEEETKTSHRQQRDERFSDSHTCGHLFRNGRPRQELVEFIIIMNSLIAYLCFVTQFCQPNKWCLIDRILPPQRANVAQITFIPDHRRWPWRTPTDTPIGVSSQRTAAAE